MLPLGFSNFKILSDANSLARFGQPVANFVIVYHTAIANLLLGAESHPSPEAI